jgi:hypothetical protein
MLFKHVVQTAEKFIERCMLMSTDPGDLVFWAERRKLETHPKTGAAQFV